MWPHPASLVFVWGAGSGRAPRAKGSVLHLAAEGAECRDRGQQARSPGCSHRGGGGHVPLAAMGRILSLLVPPPTPPSPHQCFSPSTLPTRVSFFER